MAYDRRLGGSGSQPRSGPYVDYHLHLGRVHVPVGPQRDFTVLDPARAATLTAWVEAMIPARGGRPSAAEVGAAEYVDAAAAAVPALREVLVGALDHLGELSKARTGGELADAPPQARAEAVRSLELDDRSGAFDMVRDFTYEAYYAHPQVLRALQAELDWDGFSPTRGAPMEAFDEGLLARVRSLPDHYRDA